MRIFLYKDILHKKKTQKLCSNINTPKNIIKQTSNFNSDITPRSTIKHTSNFHLDITPRSTKKTSNFSSKYFHTLKKSTKATFIQTLRLEA